MHELLLLTAKYLILIVGLIAFIHWLTVPRQEKICFILTDAIAEVATFVLVKIGAALFYNPRLFSSLTMLVPCTLREQTMIFRQIILSLWPSLQSQSGQLLNDLETDCLSWLH